ncbi:OadG family transporter subunit [Danxiaibacter flavus]|uniref:OadG family transporter subunit n=1 Tax=Danxiaibacter flavus TaxID=3049108 RepID=A0ABV3ZHQ8_9BACT|nr:OadG family transporter subunit [Chitinophagaceae bacterium DXS]
MNNDIQEGIIILIIGMGIVFLALIVLQQVFQNILPAILSIKISRTTASNDNTSAGIKQQYNSAEEITAISAAVHMFLDEMHDEENAILTINQSVKNYSPWSSKIYGSHNFIRR